MWLPSSCRTRWKRRSPFWAGRSAGIVNPINPLLEPEKISAILRETNAKVVVTLKPFPKTDLAQKVSEAVRYAPNVKTILEVDLVPYLSGLKKLIVPLVRPKNPAQHSANVKDFRVEMARMPSDKLTFADRTEDHVAAYFHTGGTTGMPKVAQHKISGMVYNGWLGATLLFKPTDVVICPLADVPRLRLLPDPDVDDRLGRACRVPDPAGLSRRGRLRQLLEADRALQGDLHDHRADRAGRPDAAPGERRYLQPEERLLRFVPLPVELYNRFKKETGIEIVEGYGLTEATCLVSINPPDGVKKIGSVGLMFPYCNVRILTRQGATDFRECAVDEVGEICVSNPGVYRGLDLHRGRQEQGAVRRRPLPAHRRPWAAGRGRDICSSPGGRRT